MTVVEARPARLTVARYRCGKKPRIATWQPGLRRVRHGCPTCGASRWYRIEVRAAATFDGLIARWPDEPEETPAA